MEPDTSRQTSMHHGVFRNFYCCTKASCYSCEGMVDTQPRFILVAVRVALEIDRRLIGRRLNRCSPANIVQGELIHSTFNKHQTCRRQGLRQGPLQPPLLPRLDQYMYTVVHKECIDVHCRLQHLNPTGHPTPTDGLLGQVLRSIK